MIRTSNRGPSRALLVAALSALLALGGIGSIVAARSAGKSASAGPSRGSTSLRVVPIAFADLRSKMGMSTGAQLWQASLPDIDKEITGISGTGARWLRTALHWRDVEPIEGGVDDWSKADRIVTDAQAAGISVIFNIAGAPDWAGAAAAGEFGDSPAQYGAFAAKVAARYAGRVRVFELGNEPNHINYVTHPSAVVYAEILRAAYTAIKAVDPGAFVLTGGLGGTRAGNGNIDGATFAAQLYEAGAKNFFDGISYHPYTYPMMASVEATVGGRGWSRMLLVRQTMVQNGDAAKPIWITEVGAPTAGTNSVTEAEQRAILHDAFDLWQTYSWGGVMCWFTYQDKGTDTTTHKDWFGLVDSTGQIKPAYAAYTALLPPSTSQYTTAEMAEIESAASKLVVDRAEFQLLGSQAFAWLLGITRSGPFTPAPNTGDVALTTDRSASEYAAMTATAESYGTTLPEFQKTGALFLAYVLALPKAP